MAKAIVLVSSGMDSTVCAALAKKEVGSVIGLHFQYGQRSAKKEFECVERIAEFLKFEKLEVVNLERIFRSIGASALTDSSIEVPEYGGEGIPVTYVPFRNGVFLAVAVAYAVGWGVENIYIGVNQVDFSGYPDCRDVFIKAMQEAVSCGIPNSGGVRIVAPLQYLSKVEIVRLGVEVGAPFHLTWSCYREGEVACGRCDSCRLRYKGFKEAGVKDPIPYEVLPE
jgi:7-cyano-7-deazaguanine synthase